MGVPLLYEVKGSCAVHGSGLLLGGKGLVFIYLKLWPARASTSWGMRVSVYGGDVWGWIGG